MKKAILLLTLSGLVLCFGLIKATEKGLGEKGITLTLLDAPTESVTQVAATKETPKVIVAKVKPVPTGVKPEPAFAVVVVAKPAKIKKTPLVKGTTVREEEAVRIALARVPGQVREVEYKKGHYKVKIYSTEGRKAKVYVHADSGDISRIKMKS